MLDSRLLRFADANRPHERWRIAGLLDLQPTIPANDKFAVTMCELRELAFVRVDAEKKVILMEVDIDTNVSQVGDFFEIYVSRLLIARRAAKFLGCEYHLVVNGTRVY